MARFARCSLAPSKKPRASLPLSVAWAACSKHQGGAEMTTTQEMQGTYAAMARQARGKRVPGGSLAGKAVRQPAPPEEGELKPTPQEIDGPYFRLGAPPRSNLLETGDKAELILSGRVLNTQGTPIPNAMVNIWTSDGV